MNYCDIYLTETIQLLHRISPYALARIVERLVDVKKDAGRVFCLGVGGSSATASHAVNDLRKICGIEAYAPTDNVAELTARINDEGAAEIFVDYLLVSKLSVKDAVFIFSVGGGATDCSGVSWCLSQAAFCARVSGASLLGIVGRDGGQTAKLAAGPNDAVIVIPPIYSERITPHTEGLAGVLLHCIVSHPSLRAG